MEIMALAFLLTGATSINQAPLRVTAWGALKPSPPNNITFDCYRCRSWLSLTILPPPPPPLMLLMLLSAYSQASNQSHAVYSTAQNLGYGRLGSICCRRTALLGQQYVDVT